MFLPPSYKIPTDPNKTIGFHKCIKIKKNILVELCNNYVISDRLVNGAYGLFKTSTTFNNKSYVWIQFFNTKVGIATRFSHSHWTLIKLVAKEIRIGKNQFHLITKIQFPIQLVVVRIIHKAQGLSLDDLIFNPCSVHKYELAYIALSSIRSKEKLYLSDSLEILNFQIDNSILEKMKRLMTIAKWKFSMPFLKSMHHSHIIIQSININSLQKYHIDYKNDHSMHNSHIICFQETGVRHACDIDTYIDV